MTRIINLLAEQSDVERALSRISARVNNPRDLLLLKNFINNSEKIFEEIKAINDKNLNDLLPNKVFFEKALKIKKVILESICEAPPINLNDGGVFREGVSKDLDSLRNMN